MNDQVRDVKEENRREEQYERWQGERPDDDFFDGPRAHFFLRRLESLRRCLWIDETTIQQSNTPQLNRDEERTVHVQRADVHGKYSHRIGRDGKNHGRTEHTTVTYQR